MKTYVLYYAESNYDGGEFCVVGVSRDRSKLEALKEEITSNQKYNDEIREKARTKQNNHYNKIKKNIKEYMMENWDAIREFNLNSTEEKANDWHTTSFNPGSPYAPEVIKKEKIVEHAVNNFQYFHPKYPDQPKLLKRLFFLDKLKSPVYSYESEGAPPTYPAASEYKNPAYPEKYLTIQEFEEL